MRSSGSTPPPGSPHMIAVGGAGSSGLPALASGTRIIAIIKTAIAATATQMRKAST